MFGSVKVHVDILARPQSATIVFLECQKKYSREHCGVPNR